MSRPETERALREARARASARIEQLKAEQDSLEGLIAFVDEYTSATPKAPVKRRRPRRKPISPIEVIRERPGVRTSMLAMLVGRPPEDVAAELAELHSRGEIQRDRLGWRASS